MTDFAMCSLFSNFFGGGCDDVDVLIWTENFNDMFRWNVYINRDQNSLNWQSLGVLESDFPLKYSWV